MADFEPFSPRAGNESARMFQIYWTSRVAGLVAFTLPLIGAMVGIGIVIGLRQGSLLGGGLIGGIVGRIASLFLDRSLAKKAIEADEAAKRQILEDRERERLRKLEEARARGDFDRWKKGGQE